MINRSFGNSVTTRRHLWKAFWTVEDVETTFSDPILANRNSDSKCDLESFYSFCSTFPKASEFSSFNAGKSNKRAVISLKSDTGQTSQNVLPYDCLLNGTVVHIDHKGNNLYVRPDVFREKALALDSHLRYISFESLEPLGPRNVRMGQVYLVFNSTRKSFARAVCGHMKFTHQNITRFQMYFIDDGRLDFIEQKDVFLLPFALGLIPPVCVPLDLAYCSKSLAFSTCVDHFRSLQIGSRIVFALKSEIQEKEIGYNHVGEQNENFPLTFTSKIFVGDSVRFEIKCPKLLKDSFLQDNQMDFLRNRRNYGSLHDELISFSTFPSLAQQRTMPCKVTVRVARRCDREGVYWMIDERTLNFIEEVIVQPTNLFDMNDTHLKFYPCIAYVKVDHEATKPCFCRALVRNYSVDGKRCNVFLIDYAKFVTCDVFSLFTLEGQPQTIYETPGAAFLTVVQNCDATGVIKPGRAYLCEGVTYSITLLSVDKEEIFCSSIFFPTMENLFDKVKVKETLFNSYTSDNASDLTGLRDFQNMESMHRHVAGNSFISSKELKESNELIDVKAALLKLESKVSTYYDKLHWKLELLSMRGRELVHEISLQAASSLTKRTKNSSLRSKLHSRPNNPIEVPSNNSGYQTSSSNIFRKKCCNNFFDEVRKRDESVTVEELGTDDLHKSEVSSSTDSGIDHSDEHSPSSRSLSPFAESKFPKYKALFPHAAVLNGKKYWVKRSNDDYMFLDWPLFFVHVLSEENMRILEQLLDTLETSSRLNPSELDVGKLCIAYSSKYKARFRAVINAVKFGAVEVFYVDYGNYECLDLTSLYSIAKQSYAIQNQPGMAIPCIFFAADRISTEENYNMLETFKSLVASDQNVFCLRFVAQRADGVYVVEKTRA